MFMQEIKDFTQTIVHNVKFSSNNVKKEPSTARIGACPLCGGDVVERGKAYGCSKWAETGCKFVIWKTIAGKEIDKAQILQLIEKKECDKISGFISKSGKPFDAQLILAGDRVQFKFIN